MNGHEAYNVVIDIENPLERTEGDEQVIELVDSFLRSHGEYPVATVINTIFPYKLFLQHGTPDIYDKYLGSFHETTKVVNSLRVSTAGITR
jgi:hypothetical protein